MNKEFRQQFSKVLGKLNFTRTPFYKFWLRPRLKKLFVELRYSLGSDRQPGIITDIEPIAGERGWNYKTGQPVKIQQREPSKTIVDEIREIVMNGRERVHKNRMTQTTRNVARGMMYYTHLYSVTRYPVYETFTCEISNAILVGKSGVVLTPQQEVFAQSTFERLRSVTDLPFVGCNLPRHEPLPGEYVSLLAWSAKNYTHWLMDCLPRLDLLDHYENYKVIVPAKPTKYQIDLLALLGINENRIIEMNMEQMVVEKLIFAHAAQRSGIPSAIHLKNIRDRLVTSANAEKAYPRRSSRIWISRDKSARKIINEEQLYPILQEFGFDVLFCEDLSVVEQIQIFSMADVVAGAHGAGMINHIFCGPGATVIEVYNNHRWEHAACRIASLMGHEHWHIFGENRGHDWETWVDPDKFEKILIYALEKSMVGNNNIFDLPY